mmetsp:Transcript_26713/g.67336  ORF Transcript_26713/g.67336 Transcript_26713/m.67336 type:complete len:289 (+) Transcript_26713:1117-1983(+)
MLFLRRVGPPGLEVLVVLLGLPRRLLHRQPDRLREGLVVRLRAPVQVRTRGVQFLLLLGVVPSARRRSPLAGDQGGLCSRGRPKRGGVLYSEGEVFARRRRRTLLAQPVLHVNLPENFARRPNAAAEICLWSLRKLFFTDLPGAGKIAHNGRPADCICVPRRRLPMRERLAISPEVRSFRRTGRSLLLRADHPPTPEQKFLHDHPLLVRRKLRVYVFGTPRRPRVRALVLASPVPGILVPFGAPQLVRCEQFPCFGRCPQQLRLGSGGHWYWRRGLGGGGPLRPFPGG